MEYVQVVLLIVKTVLIIQLALYVMITINLLLTIFVSQLIVQMVNIGTVHSVQPVELDVKPVLTLRHAMNVSLKIHVYQDILLLIINV